MADLSALPALSIDPVGFGARNSLLQSQAASAYQQQQTQSQLAPLEVERAQALTPLEIQAAKDKQRMEEMQTSNAVLAQVAKDAQAADPEDAPSIWDQGMKKAAANGITTAGQYVGHYRPDLAERVTDIYGGAGGQGRGGAGGESAAGITTDVQAVDRAVASMPPAQLGISLKRADFLINSFNNVKDRQSWDNEIQLLKDNGIDVSHILPNTEWNPLNYAAASRAIKNLTPYRDAMAKRSAILSTGAVPPAPAPQGTSSFIGTDPQTQRPVYHNPVTGQDTIGQNPVGPKPSSAISTFQYKLATARNSGMTDEDAMQFANGKKTLPAERLRAIALEQANKELGDITLSGTMIPNPEDWVRRKAAENYAILSAPSPGASSRPAPAAASAPTSGRKLSQPEIQQSLSNAREALKRGWPRAEVIQRLQAAGVPTQGL